MGPMKIQPIDIDSERVEELIVRNEPASKWRLRRLFAFELKKDGGGAHEWEPSSVCLAKMVQNFMEDQPQSPRCGRNRCNCFNANASSDDFFDLSADSISDATDLLKRLIPCSSVGERNLLGEVARMVEKKNGKRKDDLIKIVVDGLSSLGYDSSICISNWDKTSSSPSGSYQFVDVIVEGETLIIDIDFRSEFQIARPSGTYKAILQSLPYIFVGKPERLRQIVCVVSEAAKQSLNKKGMHVPPWRKPHYMLAKWLSPSTARSDGDSGEMGKAVSPAWQPPAVKPRSVERGAKVVTGLASLLKDKP